MQPGWRQAFDLKLSHFVFLCRLMKLQQFLSGDAKPQMLQAG
jgi:hypothetical protein